MNETKKYAIKAFKAADLDGNGTVDLYEFTLLYRYIEGNKIYFK